MAIVKNVVVRRARRSDIRVLAELLHDLALFPEVNREPLDETAARITPALTFNGEYGSRTTFVAERAARRGGALHIAGYLAVNWFSKLIPGTDGYITELFVREADRGAGVGTALLEAAEFEAHKRGCTRLMLINLTKRDSYKRGFYQKHGFTERDDVAFFTKSLAPQS